MKVLLSYLLFSAFSHDILTTAARTYGGFVNHEMDKDTAGLFRPRNLRHQDESSSTFDENLRQRRRTEGEIPVPPEFDEDDDVGGGDESVFYPAETLDYFKKGIDPQYFVWANEDEIAPGAQTCGFMEPALGTTPGLTFPSVLVYVCIRFANVQPAKKGNMFVHCGGPSSLTDCAMVNPLFVGEQALDDYNILTIDQRGMGRSWPSFAHEACNLYAPLIRDDNGTVVDFTLPPELENGRDYFDFESVKLSLEPYKRRVFRCWGCDDCDFRLNATQEDGSVNTYHFLEYSGTRQLAEDIERMRMLINAPVMNIYGISYGTSVFGTYATLFPQSVGLMVLDGNVNPIPDLEYIAYTLAKGKDTRIQYSLFSCNARNIEAPGSCPVDDLLQCVNDINALLREQFDIQAGSAVGTIAEILSAIGNAPEGRGQEVCDLAAAGDVDGLIEAVEEIQELVGITSETRQPDVMYNTVSGPTSCGDSPEACAVYGNSEYYFFTFPNVVAEMVQAQDDYSAQYDADYFAKKVVEFAGLHTGAGTGEPVASFYSEWAQGFYWPKGVPLAPIGNPALTGIVAGQLYDPNTPYVWTQNMRNAFKYTSLLTSQATAHGLAAIDPSCQQHVIDYFTTGFVQIVDGTVCGYDYASASIFATAFGLI